MLSLVLYSVFLCKCFTAYACYAICIIPTLFLVFQCVKAFAHEKKVLPFEIFWNFFETFFHYIHNRKSFAVFITISNAYLQQMSISKILFDMLTTEAARVHILDKFLYDHLVHCGTLSPNFEALRVLKFCVSSTDCRHTYNFFFIIIIQGNWKKIKQTIQTRLFSLLLKILAENNVSYHFMNVHISYASEK